MTTCRSAYEKAVRHHQSGNPDQAEHLYRELLAKWTGHAPSLNLLGVLLSQKGRHQEAAELLEHAIRQDNSVPAYHNNLGTIYKALELHDKALACYTRALQLKPDYPEALNNQGTLREWLGEYREAADCYQQAILIRPEFAEVHANLGNALKQLRQYSAAIECFRRAISLKPVAEYYNNLANALTELGRHDEALLHYERAMICNPDYAEARSNLLCHGQYLPTASADILRETAEKVYGRWANQRIGVRQRPELRPLRTASDTTDRPLRLGYVSGDFCCHPVGLFIKDVLAAHDPTSVLPFVYSNGSIIDNVTREMQTNLLRQHGSMTGWLDVRYLDDSNLAERIRADQIDILVDLAGHTGKNRLSVFALRPAPVQLSWLGYYATTGLSAIDAVILDPWHAPPGTEAEFTERIVRMPHNRFCYTPVSFAPAVAPSPVFKNGFITFGSFNNSAKLNEEVLGVWAQIIQTVPESRLILKWRTFADVLYRERISAFFAAQGISTERVELRPISAHPKMLEEYADIDIALDPFPFSGGHTSCEALWMGVPVITWSKKRVVSRQTFSFLANIGLTELAASSVEEYIDIATTLAANYTRLKELRLTLRRRMATSPLCNVQGFTRHLEEIYTSIFRSIANEVQVSPGYQSNEPSQKEAPTEKDLESLKALYNAGRHVELEAATWRLIERTPGEGTLWKIFGLALTLQGKDALAALHRAVQFLPEDADAHNDLGTAQNDFGLHDHAAESYRRALKLRPDFAEAHYNLGNTFRNLGQHAEAVTCYRQGIKLNPNIAVIHNNLGNALKDLGQFDEAVDCFKHALHTSPEYAEAHNNLAKTFEKMGRLDEAEASYFRALEIRPDYAEIHVNLGNILKEQGRSDEAEASYRQALTLKPDLIEAHFNLGNTLRDLTRLAEAESSYRRVLALKTDHVEAHINLGSTLKDLGLLAEAEAIYRRALEIKPECAEAHHYLGIVLKEQRQFEAAVACYRRALTLKPEYADALCNLGHVLQTVYRFDEAIICFRRALELNPAFVIAHNNLGSALKDLGRFDEAAVCFRRALEIDPNCFDAHDNLLFTHHLHNVHHQEILADVRRYGEMLTRRAQTYHAWSNIPAPERPLRIGWVSGDLCVHPVGYFVEGIFAALANSFPNIFQHIAYQNNFSNDVLTERIKIHCNGWNTSVNLTDKQLAQRICEDGIDILIDLSGHTAHNRLPVFAWKPAPVQVTWLGYFATTGVAQIDYLIADPWTLPTSEEINFTEKIWRLPETRLCFTPPDIDIHVSSLPSLTTNHITFGCFNNLAKMNDDVVALWSRILQTVTGSRLFLKSKQLQEESAQQQIRQRFALHGIHGDRLILEGPTHRADYLAAFHRVDMSLDPFPYSGGTTTVESLWMGVPVLTLTGENFLSRQGVGLMMNAGLSDWVATDRDDYVALAVSHATDLRLLSALRSQLRQQVLASPVFNAPRFAWHFAEALRGMWREWCGK